MAVKEKKKLPQRTREESTEEKVVARRPRVLIVGGEVKNFKGSGFRERFDCEIHMKTDGNSLRLKDDRFDAVVSLPWITPTLSRNSKIYAKNHGIPFIESPKVGQIEIWLGKHLKWAKAYFDELDRAPKAADPVAQTPEAILAQVTVPENPSSMLWDEDQLWSAYGEPFVQQLKGLDGETTDRKTFVELMEEETGLKGEPVEIMIAMLRRQGIISEADGGVVAIGSVAPVDLEKRKQYIERQAQKKKPFNNGSRSVRDEVREAFSDDDESKGNRGHYFSFSDDDLLEFYKKLEHGRVFIQNEDLFNALTAVGLRKDERTPFSNSGMRIYLSRLEKAEKIVRVRTGVGYSFRVFIPGYTPENAHQLTPPVVSTPAPPPPPVAPAPPPPEAKAAHDHGILTGKPFAAAFPAQEESHPDLPFPAPVDEKDITKQGVLYSLLEKAYSNGRLPELGGLVAAVRAFRGLFYETAWDAAAIKGILIRLKLPLTDSNQKKAGTRKLEFTDDEWSYFALEYLRDQTLFALLPLIDDTNRIWKICEGCQKHFYFNIPRICYECKEDNRRIVESVKGN